MIFIKKSKNKKKKYFFFNKFLFFYFLSTISIAIIFCVFIFTSSYFKTKTFKFLDHFSKAGRFEYIYIFDIGWNAIKSNFYPIKKIDLEISFENILIIENYRKKAIENETLGNSENIPEVNGNILFNNKKSKTKIRLKGERKLHFEEKNKSSYKVDLKKNKYILGMNKFSLQKPRVRNYIHEWLFHEMAEDLGLIKMKYQFVKLNINGANQGLYVIEESFGKEMIERNNRRNGPIFAFDDNMVNFSTKFKVNENTPFFEIYNKKYWNREENISLVNTASQKLRDFIDGKRSLEHTFDLDKFANFFAIIDATYTYHALSPGTLKLYYNPINGIFEPIPFDGQRAMPNYYEFNSEFDNSILIDNKGSWWVDKFFFNKNNLNINFYNKYLDSLKKISSDEYLNSFFKIRKKEINKINSFIYLDYFFYANDYDFGPGLYYFKKKDLYYRAKVLKKRIDSSNKNVQIIRNKNKDYIIKVFFKNCFKCKPYTSLINITLKNITCFKVGGLTIDKMIIPINKKLNFNKNTLINISKKNKDLECSNFEFYDHGTEKVFIKTINNLNSFYKTDRNLNIKDNLLKQFFFEKNYKLYLKSDSTIINKSFIIPKNYKVIINPGQKIILKDNAFIFSKSPWLVEGRPDKQIVISGEINNFGGGLIISETKEKSYFKNVKFSYLSGLKNDYYNKKDNTSYSSRTYYTEGIKNNYNEELIKKKDEESFNDFIILGSINFYRTEVKLENISLTRINSEDAINVINSKFEIDNIEFVENGSDSIDFDFSEGVMNNANFYNIGNDAIDFSGSNVTLKKAYFYRVSDKAISAGENSKINITDIIASKSYTGIAAKDGSMVKAKNIVMKDVQIPFASFLKKFEYEVPTLFLKNVKTKDFLEKWLVDETSKIFYDNSPVGKITKNIIPIIYEKNVDLIK